MNNINIISINVSGPVQSGKSAILSSIRYMLDSYGYCVVTPDPVERLNPSESLDTAKPHEKPVCSKTVIVLTEGDCLCNIQTPTNY